MSGPSNGRPRAATASIDVARSPSASLARRLGALLYEALLLLAMAFVAGFALLPLISPNAAASSTLAIPPVFARTMMSCILVAGAAIYYAWCWSDGRRTLPQKTWRLRLKDRADRPPTRKTALVRYAAGWLGPAAALAAYGLLRPSGAGRYAALLLMLNYAWALVDPTRQFLHDRIAHTRVVQDG